MIMNKIADTKSILARLMATEDLTVEHRPVSTAAFDTFNRILVLPIWKDMSEDLYDLFVSHEIGHALETPSDIHIIERAIKQIAPEYPDIAKGYLNVVEDARIERHVKKLYPGTKRSFLAGYQE